MGRPKVAERQPIEIREIGQCHCEEGGDTAGEHAGGRTGHGHAAPPDAHEEQGKVAGSGDGEGLSDHEVDLKLLHETAQERRDSA